MIRPQNIATWPGYSLCVPWAKRAATWMEAFAAEGDRLEALADKARMERAWARTPALIQRMAEDFATLAAAAQVTAAAWREFVAAWENLSPGARLRLARQELAIAHNRIYTAKPDTGAEESRRKWFG